MASHPRSRVRETGRRATLSSADSCAHRACACAPKQVHGDCCGAYCANVYAHESEHGACACGHAACSQAQRVMSGAVEIVTSIGRGPGAR